MATEAESFLIDWDTIGVMIDLRVVGRGFVSFSMADLKADRGRAYAHREFRLGDFMEKVKRAGKTRIPLDVFEIASVNWAFDAEPSFHHTLKRFMETRRAGENVIHLRVQHTTWGAGPSYWTAAHEPNTVLKERKRRSHYEDAILKHQEQVRRIIRRLRRSRQARRVNRT